LKDYWDCGSTVVQPLSSSPLKRTEVSPPDQPLSHSQPNTPTASQLSGNEKTVSNSNHKTARNEIVSKLQKPETGTQLIRPLNSYSNNSKIKHQILSLIQASWHGGCLPNTNFCVGIMAEVTCKEGFDGRQHGRSVDFA